MKIKEYLIKKPGGQTVLDCIEEKKLVHGLIKCAEWGFPMKCRDVQLIVKSNLDRIGKNQKNKFKNNLPGKDWVDLFLQRNKEVTLRFGENIKRAHSTKDELNRYFDNLAETLIDIPPSNIFNYDETNF